MLIQVLFWAPLLLVYTRHIGNNISANYSLKPAASSTIMLSVLAFLPTQFRKGKDVVFQFDCFHSYLRN